jgi:hypothetical protein
VPAKNEGDKIDGGKISDCLPQEGGSYGVTSQPFASVDFSRRAPSTASASWSASAADSNREGMSQCTA